MSQVLPKEGGHALGRCQLENVEQIALDIKVVVQECAEALSGKRHCPLDEVQARSTTPPSRVVTLEDR